MGLEGRRVLVTRASGQGGELQGLLEQRGARVEAIPTIEIADPASWEAADEALRRLLSYDWIIFASANAVDRFAARSGSRLEAFPGKIAAVGSRTARRLKVRHLEVHLVPLDFNAEGLLETLPDDLSGTEILLPRGETGNDALPKELTSRGAHVDVVPVYRNEMPPGGGAELRMLFRAQAIDCVTLTSGSTLDNLIQMLGVSNPLETLSSAAVAVIGPVTRKRAEHYGLRVHIEPDLATIPALVEAIDAYFSNK